MCAMPLYNPNKKYDEATVYDALKSAFANFRVLARADAAQRFKFLSTAEKYNIGRGLAYMADIAQDPAKYFSRAQTMNLWSFENKQDIITPATRVYERIIGYNLMTPEVRRQFCYLCETAKNWEYDRKSKWMEFSQNTNKFAYTITRIAYETEIAAQIANTPLIIRPFAHFLKNLFQYE